MAAVKRKAGDPERAAKLRQVYETLKKVRESKTVTLRPSKHQRDTFIALDGSIQEFKLRYYQVQGAYHMLVLKRMVLGDEMGLGKTIETLAALGHMLEKDPTAKVIIVTPKSTVNQWASEIERFTIGIKPLVVESKLPQKKTAWL